LSVKIFCGLQASMDSSSEVIEKMIALCIVMQKAVKKHLTLLQTKLDDLKTKSNARSNTDLLTPTQSGKFDVWNFLTRC